MNIFFYASEKSSAAEQYAELLLNREVLPSLTILPAGARLNSRHSLNLRNGDVMILFAATDKELKNLLTMQTAFEEFRIILILKDCTHKNISNGHLLKPRYIACTDSDTTNLENVIIKMQGHAMALPYMTEQDNSRF